MSKVYFYFFAFIFSSPLCKGQNWVRQEFVLSTSVEFPGIPDKVDTMGISGYRYFNDSAFFVIQAFNFDGMINLPIDQDSIHSFYEDIKEGMLEKSNGKLLESKDVDIDGTKGLEIKIGSLALPNLPDLQYTRIVVKGTFVLSYIFWINSKYDSALKAHRLRYFDSIKLKPI